MNAEKMRVDRRKRAHMRAHSKGAILDIGSSLRDVKGSAAANSGDHLGITAVHAAFPVFTASRPGAGRAGAGPSATAATAGREARRGTGRRRSRPYPLRRRSPPGPPSGPAHASVTTGPARASSVALPLLSHGPNRHGGALRQWSGVRIDPPCR